MPARQSHDLGGAKTILAIDDDDKTILGFYSLAPGAIAFCADPGDDAPWTCSTRRVPGFRLARIATHVRWQGQGLGGVVFIDAKNARAAQWYAGYGGIALSNQPLTLVMSLATFGTELKVAGQL